MDESGSLVGWVRIGVRSCLVAAVLATAAGPALAADYIRPSHTTRRTGAPTAVALRYLGGQADVLGLRAVEFSEPRVFRVGAHRTVRLSQQYQGLSVLGSSAAIDLDGDGRVAAAMLDVARPLTVTTQPALSWERAADSLAAHGSAQAVQGIPVLAVLPQGSGRLVWVMDVGTGAGARRYLVDANDGEVVAERSLSMDALGRVYPTSEAVTPSVEDRELIQLTPSEPQRLTGWDGQLVVTNFLGYGAQPGVVFLQQSVEPNSGEDFLYDPPLDPADRMDAFAQVNAYYHLSRVRDFFVSTFGVDMTGPQWKLVAATNVLEQGGAFDGAYYSPAGVGAPWNSPNFLGAGQGVTVDFAYDSDVFLHEFTHYVNYNAIRFNAGQFAIDEWGWSPFSIAIDEGVADYFACTLNDGPVVGEATLAPMGKQRDLSDTSKRCPADVVGEGHLDGEIIGSFCWSLRQAFGREIADQLVWGAVTMLPYGASFGDFVQGVRQIAEDLVQDGSLSAAQRDTLEELLGQRGLDDCGREVSIALGGARTTLMFGLDALAQGYETTCEQLKSVDGSIPALFHFYATPRASSHGLRFKIEMIPGGAGALEWSAYVRAGEHVRFEPGNPMPVPSRYDAALTGVTTASAELVIDATTTPAFDPSTSYHLALTHRNCPGVVARISVEEITEGEAPDGGVAGDGGPEEGASATSSSDGTGCSCRASESQAGGTWGWIGWVAIAIGVGRRGRRG